MRKINLKHSISLICLILIAAALIFSTSPKIVAQATDGTTVSIVPKDNIFYVETTPVNSTFVVNATVTDVTNLYNWQVKLHFDPSLLQCTKAFIPADSPFKFPVTPTPVIDNTTGYVMMGASLLGEVPGVNGSGVLATITFKIISAPTTPGESLSCNLTLDAEDTYLLDPDIVEMPYTPIHGYYEYALDTTHPEIVEVTQDPPPDNVLETQVVKVSVNVTDYETGVKNVTLIYTTDNWTTSKSLSMEFNATSGFWEAEIPGQALGTLVKYKIEAYDYAGNFASDDKAGEYYTYTVIPEFTAIAILILLLATLSIAILIKNSKKHLKPKN